MNFFFCFWKIFRETLFGDLAVFIYPMDPAPYRPQKFSPLVVVTERDWLDMIVEYDCMKKDQNMI